MARLYTGAAFKQQLDATFEGDQGEVMKFVGASRQELTALLRGNLGAMASRVCRITRDEVVSILPEGGSITGLPDLSELNWERYTAVYADLHINHPSLHCVCLDHYRSMVMLLRELHELVYEELLENYCVELLCVVVKEPLISMTR